MRLAVLTVGLGLFACGGDDAPSKQEFANEADRICRETEKELEQIGQSAESPEELTAVLDKVIDRSQAAAQAPAWAKSEQRNVRHAPR